MNKVNYFILNGEVVGYEDSISAKWLFNRSFYYADSFFDTQLIREGILLNDRFHLERLEKSAAVFQVELPDVIKNREQYAKIIYHFLSDNNFADKSEAIIRFQLWREGGRGYMPKTNQVSYVIECFPFHPYEPEISLTTKTTKSLRPTIPSFIKTSAAVGYTLALFGTEDDGIPLFVDSDGNVLESSDSNLVFCKSERLVIPHANEAVHMGSSIHAWMAMAEENEIPFEQRKVQSEELFDADLIFLTNAIKSMQLVTKLNERPLNTVKSMHQKIQLMYEAFRIKHGLKLV